VVFIFTPGKKIAESGTQELKKCKPIWNSRTQESCFWVFIFKANNFTGFASFRLTNISNKTEAQELKKTFCMVLVCR